MARVTDWYQLSVTPSYRGVYELLDAQGGIRRAEYAKKAWRDADTREALDPGAFSGWRGRLQQYAPGKLDAVMETLELHRDRRHAKRLFRHWVSMGDALKACRYYGIGLKLDARFVAIDRTAYKRLRKSLSEEQEAMVEKSVQLFFGRIAKAGTHASPRR